MLNNLTNFLNLIKGRRIKTTLEDSDIIAIGTKQSQALGDYKPTAIEFADLKAQVGGLQTVSVDGVTITGNGTPASPLVANIPSVAIPYSNVVFVDAVNGNNSTGAMNRFDKPYLSVSTAISAASSLPGLSIDNRALVYIRRGQYVNPSVSLSTNVDIYCEPGVVFTGTVYIRDWGVAVNANVYGNLKINAWTSTVIPVSFTGGSNITFEFDWISSQAAAMELSTNQAGSKFTINGNYIYSSTIGQGFGITIRYAANVTMNIANAIEAPHSVVNFRYYSGNTIITCPNIRLVSGNAYGGNFKQAFIVYDASSTGRVQINGDITNTDTVNYGGVTALITLNSTPLKVKINGNIKGGVIKALDGNTGAAGTFELNGDASSDDTYAVWAYGSGQLILNGNIYQTSTTSLAAAIAVNGTAKIFFRNGSVYTASPSASCLVVNGVSTVTVLDNMTLFTNNMDAVTSTAGAVSIRANASRSNKGLQIGVSDLYSPSGFIVDANTVVPTSIF